MKRRKNDRGRKRAGLRGVSQWLHSMDARCALTVAAGSLLLFLMFVAASAPERYDLKVGSISHYTITATKDVVDELTTEERRQAAADAVEPSYHLQEGASDEVMTGLARIFDELRTVQQYGLTLRQEGDTAADVRSREFDETELAYARGLITTLTPSNLQLTTLLRTETSDFDVMVTTVTTAVENSLETTIREGQVNQSIQTILQIVGYKVETSLFQNIVPTVLRACVKPNMVIEQESTEMARQKARDAVEPVMYLQGQNIIREGERVSASQLAVLRDLGLLEDNQYDLTIYAGAALMLLAAIGLLLILLRLLAPQLLHDLRRLSVIMVVMCVTVGLCVVCIKWIHVYLAPVAMGGMLITGLLGAPAGVAGTFSLALVVSSLTLGSNTFIDGFEEQIVGHKPGETFDVNVTFPDGYSDSTDANGNTVTLSGQKAVFTVVLNYISESVLPELTDAWVASNFGSFGTPNNIYTVEALRAYYQEQLYTSNLNTAVMDDLMANSTFKSIPQQVMDYQVNQCLNYYSTLAGYYSYDLDGLVQNLLGYESTDDMLAHLESSLENYSKEALLYQAVAESLDITPTQEQLDAYSDYKDTYGQNYCTMVALMDAVTSTLTSGAVVS